jgi:hypothetical protein
VAWSESARAFMIAIDVSAGPAQSDRMKVAS